MTRDEEGRRCAQQLRLVTRVEYGRAEIRAFNQAAGAGQLEFDKDAVREVVRLYDVLVAEQRNIKGALNLAGFGGFGSAQQLAAGFSNKAIQLFDVLAQFIEGAMILQEAYLRAGKLYEEADQKNSALGCEFDRKEQSC